MIIMTLSLSLWFVKNILAIIHFKLCSLAIMYHHHLSCLLLWRRAMVASFSNPPHSLCMPVWTMVPASTSMLLEHKFCRNFTTSSLADCTHAKGIHVITIPTITGQAHADQRDSPIKLYRIHPRRSDQEHTNTCARFVNQHGLHWCMC